MISLLAKLCMKNPEDRAANRRAYGILCGVVGIALNLFLFALKLFAGKRSGSIAITADAVNNLSDAGSSLVLLAGFWLAGKKPDIRHPFGHGRMEYISGLVVAAAILLMGYELVRDSVLAVLNPAPTEFTPLVAAILAVSILVKLYMAQYNQSIGYQIDSVAMRAAAGDSLSDMMATSAVFAAAVAADQTGALIDGWCGLAVGLFVFCSGLRAAKDTLNPLLGQAPAHDYVERIDEIVMAHPQIRGMHDLIVHDYGPGRQMISLHAEVPAEGNILDIHDTIDNIERELREKLGCDATIHMDPVVTSDECVGETKAAVAALLKAMDSELSLHDFRMITGKTHTNLIFDVTTPYDFRMDDAALLREIQNEVREHFGEQYHVIARIERSYI